MQPHAQPTTLREIVRVLFLYRGLVLGTMLVFAAVAGGITYWSPDEYVASQELWLRDETAHLRRTGESPREQYERIQTAAANLREMMLSRDVLRQTAVSVLGERFSAASPLEQSRVLADLAERIGFRHKRSSEFGASQVIEISLRHHDRDLARALLRELVRRAEEQLRAAGQRHAATLVRTLEEALRQQRAELDEAIARLHSFIEDVGAGIFDVQATGEAFGQTAVAREELTDVQRELNAVENQIRTKEALVAQVRAAVQAGDHAGPAEFLEGYPQIAGVRQALLDALLSERNLQAVYAPEHPALLEAKDRVAELRQLYGEQLRSLERSVSAELSLLRRVRANLEARRDELADRVAALAGRYPELLALRSDVDRKQQAVLEAESRLAAAQTELVTAGQTTFFVRLGEVQVSDRPISLSDVSVMLLGSCLGLLCGVGLAFLANHYSHTVRHESDLVRRGITLPVLATIPEVDAPLVYERN